MVATAKPTPPVLQPVVRQFQQLGSKITNPIMQLGHILVFAGRAIAGVPIGGLHIATALSLQMDRPLLYLRPARDPDEVLAPHVEGIYRPGQHVLVVDDLAAGGGSLVETIEGLRDAGLIVANAVVLIDREQGAARRLEAMGVRMHSILTLEVLLTYLHSAGHVNREDYDRSQGYLRREGEPRSEFD